MITMQELHAYNKMVLLDILPGILCPLNELDGYMVPWADENNEPCMWCLACDTKSYLGLNQIEKIKLLLHP